MASKVNKVKFDTTQRAYTLILANIRDKGGKWRLSEDLSDKLWKTHQIINKGAKVFGDWILTIRAGLNPDVINSINSPEDEKYKRLMLALCWFTVESKEGAPAEYIVAEGTGDLSEFRQTKDKLMSRLEIHLKHEGLDGAEIERWKKDCELSFSAVIREDSVWVDRRQMFKDKLNSHYASISEDCKNFIKYLFVGDKGRIEDYLRVEDKSQKNKKSNAPSAEEELDEDVGSSAGVPDTEETSGGTKQKAGDKEFAERCRGWLSRNWGKEKEKSDKRFKIKNEKYKVLKEFAYENYIDSSGNYLCKAILNNLLGKNYEEKSTGKVAISGNEDDLIAKIKSASGFDKGREPGFFNELRKLLKKDKIEESDAISLKKKLDNLRGVKDGGFEDVKKTSEVLSNVIKNNIESFLGISYRQVKNGSGKEDSGKDLIDVFCVMFEHAARRVSVMHTCVKKQEAARMAAVKLAAERQIPHEAEEFLNNYCLERSIALNSLEDYRITRAAITGWKNIVKAWKTCKNAEERLQKIVEIQSASDVDKFGDANLFRALASENASFVWRKNGKADEDILPAYVAKQEADYYKFELKVPMYRHPHPLLNPVWCDYGKSRMGFKIIGSNEKHAYATMDIFDGISFVKYEGVNVLGERFFKEVRLVDKQKKLFMRLDRFGIVSHNIKLDMTNWQGAGIELNARLQTDRKYLERIFNCIDEQKAINLKKKIRWFITISPEMVPDGPWIKYCRNNNIEAPYHSPYWKENTDGKRKGRAIIRLARLPGLRVLGVDLGHRYGAACAVWRTLSKEEVEKLCVEYNQPLPGPSTPFIYFKCVKKTEDGGERIRNFVIRRIGGDYIKENGDSRVPHPAPFAILERQFLIKLQGEDKEPRKPTAQEVEALTQLCKEISADFIMKQKHMNVVELVSMTLDVLKSGLRQHNMLATLIRDLKADKLYMTGGVVEEIGCDLTKKEKALYRALKTTVKIKSSAVKNLLDELIKDVDKKNNVVDKKNNLENISFRSDKDIDRLRSLSASLARPDWDAARNEVCMRLTEIWRNEDRAWPERIRTIKKLLIPSKHEWRANSKKYRNVGGLSLERIANIELLRKIQQTYYTRPKPDGESETLPEKFALHEQEIINELRLNRVKQLASRIVEAALGIGAEPGHVNGKPKKRGTGSLKEPCHAVVTEFLDNYRPFEERTRRENRRLMIWTVRRLQDYLRDECNLNGILFEQVSPAYTSVQDSRTGAAGMRFSARDIRSVIADIKRGKLEDDELAKHWDEDKRIWNAMCGSKWQLQDDNWKLVQKVCDVNCCTGKSPEAVFVKEKGGEMFISSDEKSPLSRGIQADLNAAANIGLKALIDPDWTGTWWYLKCDANGNPEKDDIKGSKVFFENSEIRRKKSSREGKDEKGTFWCDIQKLSGMEKITCPVDQSVLENYKEYWNKRNSQALLNMKHLALKGGRGGGKDFMVSA